MKTTALRPLKAVRILSLALNVPGPAALMRCHAMGARCTKVEPPQGDPMGGYDRKAYDSLHQGVRILNLDLKSKADQARLERTLASSDVLLTSFRPSALENLNLHWKALHKRHPQLSLVAIVGSSGPRAEEPGHDLTYMADNDLIPGLDLPPTLYADMGGALMASEAVLQVVLASRAQAKGVAIEVSLSAAAAWASLPRQWGLTLPTGAVGGAHAGYQIYSCKDGRVACAALEPRFAAALCDAADLHNVKQRSMLAPETRQAIAAFMASQTCKQLNRLAIAKDIPLHTMPN